MNGGPTNKYVQLLKACNNHWNHELGVHQTNVLIFIIERTARYNKLREAIPDRHFEDHQILDGDGRLLHRGVNVARSSRIEHLKLLEARKLIAIHRGGRYGNEYSIRESEILHPLLGEYEKYTPKRVYLNEGPLPTWDELEQRKVDQKQEENKRSAQTNCRRRRRRRGTES